MSILFFVYGGNMITDRLTLSWVNFLSFRKLEVENYLFCADSLGLFVVSYVDILLCDPIDVLFVQ